MSGLGFNKSRTNSLTVRANCLESASGVENATPFETAAALGSAVVAINRLHRFAGSALQPRRRLPTLRPLPQPSAPQPSPGSCDVDGSIGELFRPGRRGIVQC